jgi:hypothetical protein
MITNGGERPPNGEDPRNFDALFEEARRLVTALQAEAASVVRELPLEFHTDQRGQPRTSENPRVRIANRVNEAVDRATRAITLFEDVSNDANSRGHTERVADCEEGIRDLYAVKAQIAEAYSAYLEEALRRGVYLPDEAIFTARFTCESVRASLQMLSRRIQRLQALSLAPRERNLISREEIQALGNQFFTLSSLCEEGISLVSGAIPDLLARSREGVEEANRLRTDLEGLETGIRHLRLSDTVTSLFESFGVRLGPQEPDDRN